MRALRTASTRKNKFVTGHIQLPDVSHQPLSKIEITIKLQDCNSIEEKDISQLSMEVPYLGHSSNIPFALSYQSSQLVAKTPEWYTLRILVKSKRDGRLLSFNHRITRAFDDKGLPLKDIQVPMMAVGATPTNDNVNVRLDLTAPRIHPRREGKVLSFACHDNGFSKPRLLLSSRPLMWV